MTSLQEESLWQFLANSAKDNTGEHVNLGTTYPGSTPELPWTQVVASNLVQPRQTRKSKADDPGNDNASLFPDKRMCC